MKLMILDGNSIMNRAFFGVKLLSTRDGLYTNAVFGFLNIMEKMRQEEAPDALCVAFDLKGPTFRHLRYEGYKATRHPMPEELSVQMPLIREVLEAMRIPVFEAQGWEADDILGTVGKKCGEQGWQCVIVTGDRDSLQLVDPGTSVKLIISRPGSTTATLYTPELFREEYGFEPERMIDLKALMGDSSDNIPGVAGIGMKTASDLLKRFGDLERIYASLPELRDSVRKKLEAGRESAALSYELATIVCSAPVEFRPEDCVLREPDRPRLRALFEKLQFFKMIEKYGLRGAEAEEEARPEEEKPETLTALPEKLTLCALAAAGDSFAAALPEGVLPAPLSGETLRHILSDAETVLCADWKTLCRRLDAMGYPRPARVFDVSLAGYVLDPTKSDDSAAQLSQLYLSQKPEETPEAEALAILRLFPILRERIDSEGLSRIYDEIDLPLCAVLAEMEEAGIALDRQQLEAFGEMLEERIAHAQELIYLYAGESFNINSTKQLGELLFEKLGLPAEKKTKSGYSTNAEVLEKLRGFHPIIEEILEYRQLTKLKSTYADGLLKELGADGRIRTTFQNMSTATGRLSSTEPNLQNIPVRTELGAEIRKMFVPRTGCVLVDADYSQIELRVLSHIAEDAAMQEAFRSGEDFHSVTASQVFGVPLAEVTPGMRRSAKAVNFGIVYGITKWSLSEDIGVSVGEAQNYIDAYLRRFSGVKAYMAQIIETANRQGFVTTLYGRKRALPELKNSNFNIRKMGERMALNTPVQGTAADIIKLAMLRVSRRLREAYPEARLVLQVHDELIVECPEEDAAGVEALVRTEMERAAALDVPLIAEAKSGKSWYEAK